MKQGEKFPWGRRLGKGTQFHVGADLTLPFRRTLSMGRRVKKAKWPGRVSLHVIALIL